MAMASAKSEEAYQSMLPFLSSPSRIHPSIPRSKDSPPHSAESFRSEEYRQLFRLPPDEVLIRDFNCALQENILLQGHMYLFVHYICFYSNIFGFETKKIIAFNEITCVRKAKTAAIFPNAIEIFSGEKKHFFASFFSRDEAYRLIVDGWSQHDTNDKALPDCQESRSDTSNEENEIVLFERVKILKGSTNDLNSEDRNKDASTSDKSRSSSDNEDVNALPTKLSQVHDIGVGKDANHSPCGVSLSWKLEDVDAPKIPDCYTKVAESKFQIGVEEFFSLFFSNDAVEFVETFHRKCGDKDFKCTTWYDDEQFGHARDVSFQHPIKIYFGAKYGYCQEVQKFWVYKDGHLVIETSQEVNDVPYADYFRVQGIWDVEQEGDKENGCCIMRVYVHVAFSRKTIWKGKIEQSTVEECREAYAVWINSAHELLKQKQDAAKVEGVASYGASEIPNNDHELKGFAKISRPTEEDHSEMTPRNFQGGSDSKYVPQIGHGRADLTNAGTSMASLYRESRTTFCSFVESQNNFPVTLVIAFISILIIMQLSIIVLLVRPPKVHLVYQENSVNSLTGDRTEAIYLLEKQLYHLKDEMLMVEAWLEKIQHEYVLLKTNLQDLNLFEPKS